jgi:hypothetical protein
MNIDEFRDRFLLAARDAILSDEQIRQLVLDMRAMGVTIESLSVEVRVRVPNQSSNVASDDAEFLKSLRIAPDIEVR